jgi:hypothetical protein
MKILAMLAAMTLVTAAAQANPPTYRVVVSQAPGGVTDVGCRTFWTEWEKKTGKKAVIINRPGALGSIALRSMADADGPEFACTGAQNLIYNQLFFPEHAGHERNVENIGKLADFPILISSSLRHSSVRTLKEWRDQTTSSTKPLFIGVNTSVALAMANYLIQHQGFNLEVVRLKSANDAIPAMSQGDLDYYMGTNTFEGLAQPGNPNGKLRLHSRIMGNVTGPLWDDRIWANLYKEIQDRDAFASFLGVGVNVQLSPEQKKVFEREFRLVISDSAFKTLIETRVPGSTFSGKPFSNQDVSAAVERLRKLKIN